MGKNNDFNGMPDKEAMEVKVIDFFNRSKTVPYNYKQISSAIGADTPLERAFVVQIMEELAVEGVLKETTPGKFKMVERNVVNTGTFVRRSNGKNSVVLDSGDGEVIFVAERHSKHALNGDKVKVHICAKRANEPEEAEVLEIIERKPQVFIGTLKVDDYFGHLITDSKFLATDIFIPKDLLKDGKTGDKAVVRIVDWPETANSPMGEVVDVLGRTGDNNVEMHAILAEFGLPYSYPAKVEAEANKIDPGITPEVIACREDMRDVVTFTIDPRDAKDFDDALSIQKLDNGLWQVGIHIADVTHYVKPGTIIDSEAEERATSVYLVDRTIPMLPERLSNFICSLRPNEEKLTHSVVVEVDDDANVKSSRICHTVIKSDRRFTYEEAQQIIETGEGDYRDEVLTLDRLAKKLRAARFAQGSLEFNRAEVRFDIDSTGRPVNVFFKESKDANKLVEEFMLLANKLVAEAVGAARSSRSKKAFVYRVHGEPDPQRMQNLADIALKFGHKLKITGSMREVNASVNKLLRDIKGRPEEDMIAMLAIRSMAKAVYTTFNVGHYGLAFDYYTHFTSPIRRYPDMMVHRLLDRYLASGRSVNADKLEEECKHSSEMEQLAANAERASIKYKQVEYLGERLGEVFTGRISGVTEWGLYVELDENMCEGLVPIRDLEDDYYELDEKNYCLLGRRRNRRYSLGDRVTVQVARADLPNKMVDFALIDEQHPVGTHRIDREMIKVSQSKLEQASERARQRQQRSSERKQKQKKSGAGSRSVGARGKKNATKKQPKRRR
ncbi:MAG: ribonuclease R [Muribaculaceae bacterium]